MLREIGLACFVAALASTGLAQITVTGVQSIRWGLSDHAIGVGGPGAVVESFEDAALAPGLSVRWEAPGGPVGPVTELPNLFDPFLDDPNGTAFQGSAWDGTRVLLSARGGRSFVYQHSEHWGDLVLSFSPPLRAVGFSIHQADLSPTLVVNGVSRGSLFGLAGLAANSGRVGYVIVESYGIETISTLKIDNVGGDGFAIDHLVMLAGDPIPVMVTGSAPAMWGADDEAIGVAGARIENFENAGLIPGLQVEIDSPLGSYGPSAALPQTFDPVTQDPFGDAFDLGAWDGSAVLLNTRDNASHTYTEIGNWGDVEFHFNPPVAGVGVSMADAQLESRLIVNGRDAGPLLVQAGLPTGSRQGYIRVNALDTLQPITSLRVANGRSNVNDGLAFDHLALIGGEPPCLADFNADGELNPDDLGDYINCYFAIPPCPAADFNDDSDVNPDDLGDYINAYFGSPC